VRESSRENMPTDSYTCSQVLKGLIAGILHKPKLLNRDRRIMNRPMSLDGIDSVFGRKGCLLMCRIASLFLLQRLKGSMSSDARDFNNMETRAVIKTPPPLKEGDKENSHHSDRNVRGT